MTFPYLSIYDIDNVNKLQRANDDFFLYLNHIGGIINILHSVSTGKYRYIVNATDCTLTTESLWELFDPKSICIINGILPEFILEYNIMKIEINGSFPYHTFIILRSGDKWYILSSYANKYELRVKEIDNPLNKLNDLIDGDCDTYNYLFDTNIVDNIYKCKLYLECAQYDELPVKRLQKWIADYMLVNNK